MSFRRTPTVLKAVRISDADADTNKIDKKSGRDTCSVGKLKSQSLVPRVETVKFLQPLFCM